MSPADSQICLSGRVSAQTSRDDGGVEAVGEVARVGVDVGDEGVEVLWSVRKVAGGSEALRGGSAGEVEEEPALKMKWRLPEGRGLTGKHSIVELEDSRWHWRGGMVVDDLFAPKSDKVTNPKPRPDVDFG